MAGINKVILVGNVGKDPEVRFLPSGQPVANFSLATNEIRNSKDGKRVEKTEWHKIVAFGKLGEICGEYLSKGKLVYIEGKIQTRSWEDKNGNQKQSTEVIATSMQMLDKKLESNKNKVDSDNDNNEEENQEDIPF